MLRRLPWPLVAVWLSVLAVFWPALRGDYVDDDLDLVAASPAFRGVGHLWDAVRAPFWGTDLGYWRPLTSAAMCVGHAAGGGHPWATHAVALLAHLLATTLAYAILRRLGVAVQGAALAAAVFALHPCQVESVAWVAALGDSLAGAGTLLALYGWIGWRARGDSALPWVAWLGLALALASKESGVVALGWIAAAELALRSGWGASRRIAGGVGLAVVVGSWLLVRMLVFGDVAAGFDRGQLDLQAHGAHGLLLRLYLALGFCALPTGWLGCTPFRWIPPDVEGLVQQLWPLLGLAAGAGAAAWSAARGRRDVALLGLLGVGAAVAPAALAPASLGPWPLVDRYVYTALFGVVAILIGCGRCRAWLAIALAVACAAASALMVLPWQAHDMVVGRAMHDCPQHPEPHYLVANLERQIAEPLQRSPGDQARLQERCRAALDAYRMALTLLGRPLYAGAHLRTVIGLNAELGAAVVALTGSLRPAAMVREELQTLATAHPRSAQVQLVLGLACVNAGDAPAAEGAWMRALALDATSTQAAFNLGRLYLSWGRTVEARQLAEQILALDPGHRGARAILRQAGQ